MPSSPDNLERINGIAERSDGFVWRLKIDSGDANETAAFDDPLIIVNLSVWRDAFALERFGGYGHKQFYLKRHEWFTVMESQHFVMWWVDEQSAPPTVDEANRRLEHYNRNGDVASFGWAHLPHVKLWQQARCA